MSKSRKSTDEKSATAIYRCVDLTVKSSEGRDFVW